MSSFIRLQESVTVELLQRVCTGLFVATLVLIVGLRAQAQTKSAVDAKTLTLGVVFQDPRQPVAEHYRPLVDYAARRLSPTGKITGEVVVAPGATQMMKLLEEQRVDFYMESPYATYLINRLGAARVLLRRWKGGMAEYRSVIFTSAEGDVRRLEDLRGRIIAFEDPGSTSGYFLPKLSLLKKGFSLVQKANPTLRVPANEIGYIFAHTAGNVLSLVLKQKVAAGAFSSDDYIQLEDKTRNLVLVLHASDPTPRHLVSARKDLPEAVTRRLKEILLNMDRDKQGQEILRRTDNTTKFDLLPGGEEAVRRQLIELFRSQHGP